eukprot:TRINITY_DN5574_c0_g1_i1.p1 TRINITY_DN5574_c0_g1~~TRINITY_DN5574_c0_g1_i1.p1  ORF type:complete len:331 (+),score=80.28 TRINITY_DN5574_c0_g1_i1:376-1368(+)
MVKRRKGGPKPIVPPKMKSRRKARVVTGAFHRLTQEKERVISKLSAKDGDSANPTRTFSLAKNGDRGSQGGGGGKEKKVLTKKKGKNDAAVVDKEKEELRERLASIEKSIDELGGLEAYQDASILSTSLYRTSRWVFQMLHAHNLRPSKGQAPLVTVEIGAINTQLLSSPFLDVTAIDVMSRHPKIKQLDYFEMPFEQLFDVVVCSLVINCVTPASKRGEMLLRVHRHLKPGGHFFLVIPRTCLNLSQFMTRDRLLKSVMLKLGFKLIASKDSPKLSHFLFERTDDVTTHPAPYLPSIVRRAKKKRLNDFNIELTGKDIHTHFLPRLTST